MNILQRTLLEKIGHENGFENILPVTDDSVLLGSARHRAQAIITLNGDNWLLQVASSVSGLLPLELVRSFATIPLQNGKFVAPAIDDLAKLLRRAAKLAQSLPNQAASDYESQVQEELAKFPANTITARKLSAWFAKELGRIRSACNA